MFHETLTADEDTAWETDLAPDILSNEILLDSKWAAFISKESLKLSLYALLFLDSHIFKPCNLRPTISPIELGWSLPHAASLWDANTSTAWLQQLYQNGRGATISFDTTTRYQFQGSATKSLKAATQSLLTGTPCPHLLAALSASPFATLCVAANLDVLVHDFTRCYYQLPPSLSDPSAFHILTQAQNKSVVAALRCIAAVSSRDDDASPNQQQQQQQQQQQNGDAWRDSDSGDEHLRHAARLTALATKTALRAPDDLLIGGVVDGGVAPALATAAHLILGSYFASRRSSSAAHTTGTTTAQEDGAGGSIALLMELMPVLDQDDHGDGDAAAAEAPWVTVATVRLLLALWKTLRLVVRRARRESGAAAEATAFDPAGVALRAVGECVGRLAPDFDFEAEGGGEEEEEEEAAVGKVERGVLFLAAEMCKRRRVWPVGQAVATVLEEIGGQS